MQLQFSPKRNIFSDFHLRPYDLQLTTANISFCYTNFFHKLTLSSGFTRGTLATKLLTNQRNMFGVVELAADDDDSELQVKEGH